MFGHVCLEITLREPTAYVRWQYPLLSVKWRGFNVSLNDGKFTAKQAANTLKMAGWTGLEPATFCVTGRRSKPAELSPLKFHTAIIVIDVTQEDYCVC